MALTVQLDENLSFGANSTFDTEGSYTIGASGNQVLSRGTWLIEGVTGIEIQYSPDAGTTWRTLVAAATGGVVPSDGYNVRLFDSGGAGGTVHYSQVKGL